jgi:hypothetical protein
LEFACRGNASRNDADRDGRCGYNRTFGAQFHTLIEEEKIKKIKVTTLAIGLIFTSILFSRSISAQEPPPFDFDNGNAAIEVVIPIVIPVIFTKVSPSGGDAPNILRLTTVITNAWYDGIAPYHATAVGVNSNLGRRPVAERTNRNRNKAILYASFRVLNSLLPNERPAWRAMMTSVGLNPDDNQENNLNAIGIGNKAGNAVARFREHDGMNQLGDERNCQYNCQPYADYTGYKPKNTAYELTYPSLWQPNIESNGYGTFVVQNPASVTWRRTTPYSYNNPNQFHVPFPEESNVENFWLYKNQVDEIIAQSAAMTDEQKMTAELFNNKIFGLGFATLFASQSSGLSLEQFVILDFLSNAASFDTGIAVWNEKYRHEAVRPFSAVRYVYGNHRIMAWGGQGRGTVNIKASEWKSYLNIANHPEYPSGSAAFCAAQAQVSRRFFGSDNLGWQVSYPQGSSGIEPGITPAADLVLVFPTWTNFETRCGNSRFWAGVHFRPSIEVGSEMGKRIGNRVFDFVMRKINGVN